jgi:nucleotide-binding universal stress UspA family protein
MDTFTYFVPINFTDCCYNALQYTTNLARTSGGKVKLCHIVDLEEIPESDNPVVVSFAIDRLFEEARRKMRSLREIILLEGVRVEQEIALGDIQSELTKQIESMGPGVVVIGRDPGKPLTSDSLLTCLTRKVTSPVLVVPQSYNSRHASRAILTLDMNDKKNGRPSTFTDAVKKVLGYFSVLETKSLHFGNGAEALRWIDTVRSKGNFSPKFLSGNNESIDQLIDFIRDNKIDLLCIKENRSIFNKFFGESISKHLPRQVEAPVLVITV